MTSAHFVLIPAVLLIGIVIGWILGSRAAADAYGVELKRRDERAGATTTSLSRRARRSGRIVFLICSRSPDPPATTFQRPSANRLARLAGSPAAMIFCCARSTG